MTPSASLVPAAPVLRIGYGLESTTVPEGCVEWIGGSKAADKTDAE